MGLHFIALNWAKKIRSPKWRSISHETLDSDSRKWDSQTCHRMRRASGTPFRGPFSSALLLLTCVSYFQPRAFARDRNAVYSSSSCDATKSANSGSLRESKARLIALFDLVIVATARPDSLFQVATVGWLRALMLVAANTLKNRVSESAFNKSGSLDARSAARLARASRSASASASHRRRPALGAGPIASIISSGTARATEISFESSPLSVARASMMTLRSKPLSSNRAANNARSMYERSFRWEFSIP